MFSRACSDDGGPLEVQDVKNLLGSGGVGGYRLSVLNTSRYFLSRAVLFMSTVFETCDCVDEL